jgi:hypothetical protein
MKKIYLTEEQFKKYIERELKSSIKINENSVPKLAKTMMGNVYSHMSDKAVNGYGDENLDNAYRERISRLGINMDTIKNGASQTATYNKKVEDMVQKLISEKNSEIKKWLSENIDDLRACFDKNKSFKAGKEAMTANGDVRFVGSGEFDRLSPEKRTAVINLKDFLDREGLTFLYRYTKIPKTVKERFGMKINPNEKYWEVGNRSYENIDFGNITNNEIKDYYDGTRIKLLNNKLAELLGDDSLKDSETRLTPEGNPEEWNKLAPIAQEEALRKVAERYVKRTYGLNLVLGDTSKAFSYGNKKLSDDVLIVNFTSALRCAAWNECLLKDACYARETEKHYDNTFYRNTRNNLIWEQTKDDPELMKLMLYTIRAYIVGYYSAASKVRAVADKKYRNEIKQESLCKMSFSEIKDKYGDEAIEVLKKYVKVSTIRLNEDGDFIGQWLVDAWEKYAEDFALIGVKVTAYTCRALNYTTIKNLILNVSNESLIKGQPSSDVRFFYAVTEPVYDMLAETYYVTNSDGDEVIDFGIDEDSGRVNPLYRPLIDEEGIKGYYYKCPCGRFLNERKEGESEADKQKKLDCYRCRICYGRNESGAVRFEGGRKKGVPLYVFVKAHGGEKENFSEEEESKRRPGGHTPKEWAEIQKSSYSQAQMNENTDIAVQRGDFIDDVAVKQVTRNAVFSVANMMSNNEGILSEIKNKFYKTLKKI